jgi:hypothetical protein
MRRFDIRVILLVCLALAMNGSSVARAQYNFTFAVGYSHVDMGDNPDNLLHGKDGPYFDTDFAFNVPQSSLPLTVGLGITGSGYFDSEDQTFRLSSTTVATATLYSDVGFFELEPRLALAFYTKPRSRTGAFLKPRIGFGLLIDSYGIDHVTQHAFSTNF